jgi:hypothetical protein
VGDAAVANDSLVAATDPKATGDAAKMLLLASLLIIDELTCVAESAESEFPITMAVVGAVVADCGMTKTCGLSLFAFVSLFPFEPLLDFEATAGVIDALLLKPVVGVEFVEANGCDATTIGMDDWLLFEADEGSNC